LIVREIIVVVREIIVVVREIIVVVREIIVVVREIIVVVREIIVMNAVAPSVTSLKLFTFCFYIGKNSYQELVRMLFVLIASLDQYHPDFFLVVYHNLGIVIDDPRVRMVNGGVCGGGGGGGGGGGSEWEVKDGGDCGSERLLLDADGCAGNVWVEGSAVRNRWYKLNFNRVHAFKNLYDEYDGECFTWIDLDTIVLSDLSYLAEVDNYFIFHGGRGGGEGGRMHDVLVGSGGEVLWSVPEASYIHGSFWKLNLSLYHEVIRLDSLFRENGVRLKYDVQSIFSVMARGGGGGGYGRCPFYDGPSRAITGSMFVIGENIKVCVMNGLGVWDNKDSLGNHVNTDSLTNFWWSDGGAIFRTSMYPDKEIHILSLTFDSFFMSNVCGSSDFARLFPFLLV